RSGTARSGLLRRRPGAGSGNRRGTRRGRRGAARGTRGALGPVPPASERGLPLLARRLRHPVRPALLPAGPRPALVLPAGVGRPEGGGGGMRVLCLTNLYPTTDRPAWGTFVKSQMDSLRPLGVEFDVLLVRGWESRANYWRQRGEVRRALRGDYDL